MDNWVRQVLLVLCLLLALLKLSLCFLLPLIGKRLAVLNACAANLQARVDLSERLLG